MYRRDKAWEEAYQSQVISILTSLIAHLAVISIASDEKDRSYATDFEVKLSGGTIAVRLRRPGCKFRDLTIRARRDNGAKTELAKIKEGYAFRYLYGWTDEQGKIAEWILVDLDKVRQAGLLEKERRFIPNGDGTHFISIPAKELHTSGCLMSHHMKPRRVNVQSSLDEGMERAKHVKSYLPRVELTEQEKAIIRSSPDPIWSELA